MRNPPRFTLKSLLLFYAYTCFLFFSIPYHCIFFFLRHGPWFTSWRRRRLVLSSKVRSSDRNWYVWFLVDLIFLSFLFYKENIYIYSCLLYIFTGDAEERIKQQAVWWWSFLGVDAVGGSTRLCDWIHLERPVRTYLNWKCGVRFIILFSLSAKRLFSPNFLLFFFFFLFKMIIYFFWGFPLF